VSGVNPGKILSGGVILGRYFLEASRVNLGEIPSGDVQG
jgi:hypothetical protein